MDKPNLQPLTDEMHSWQEKAQLQVDELCEKYKITTQQTSTGFASAEFGTHVGSLISIPNLQEESDYLTILHEIGHVVFELHTSIFADESKNWMYSNPKEDRWGHIIPPDDQEMKNHVGEEEAWCWNWAFENSQIPITPEIYAECLDCLMTYHKDRVTQTGPAFETFSQLGHALSSQDLNIS